MKKIALVILLIILDQSLKYLANKSLLNFFWGDFFIKLACNPNLSWGIPLNSTVFLLLWVSLLSALFLYAKKTNWDLFLVLVISGAISNMLDRIFYGCVVDYLALGFFPIFNFADVLIVGGMVLFLIRELGYMNYKSK